MTNAEEILCQITPPEGAAIRRRRSGREPLPYIREAWLLGERKLNEWLNRFTDDVLYFMPRRKNVPRRQEHRELTRLGDLLIIEEDKRISGCGWPGSTPGWPGPRTPVAHPPPDRQFEAAPLENSEVQAKTAFLVYR
jgi:hypothetical protein